MVGLWLLLHSANPNVDRIKMSLRCQNEDEQPNETRHFIVSISKHGTSHACTNVMYHPTKINDWYVIVINFSGNAHHSSTLDVAFFSAHCIRKSFYSVRWYFVKFFFWRRRCCSCFVEQCCRQLIFSLYYLIFCVQCETLDALAFELAAITTTFHRVWVCICPFSSSFFLLMPWSLNILFVICFVMFVVHSICQQYRWNVKNGRKRERKKPTKNVKKGAQQNRPMMNIHRNEKKGFEFLVVFSSCFLPVFCNCIVEWHFFLFIFGRFPGFVFTWMPPFLLSLNRFPFR